MRFSHILTVVIGVIVCTSSLTYAQNAVNETELDYECFVSSRGRCECQLIGSSTLLGSGPQQMTSVPRCHIQGRTREMILTLDNVCEFEPGTVIHGTGLKFEFESAECLDERGNRTGERFTPQLLSYRAEADDSSTSTDLSTRARIKVCDSSLRCCPTNSSGVNSYGRGIMLRAIHNETVD